MTATPSQPIEALYVGGRDHYRRAAELLLAGPRQVVLIQRSSTLVLGPEAGWDDERAFYDAAWRSIDDGAEWFHLVSLAGIDSHLRRATSSFPRRAEARDRLASDGDIIGLPTPDGSVQPIRILDGRPDHPDFKVDRQARLLIADFEDRTCAILVENLGEQQVTFHLGRPWTDELLDVCHRQWLGCPLMTTADLARTDDAIDPPAQTTQATP